MNSVIRIVNQFLAVVVSLALGLLLLEGALRLLGWGPTPRMHRFDPVVGWVKLPDADIRRQTEEFDVRVRTNARGLRGPADWSYERQAETLRILMVGDSFTLGYTVPEVDTIPSQLARDLAARGIQAEVLNGGTEGWSTDQEVLWLATEGRRYDPDVVILQMYENDIFWNSRDQYLRYPKPRIPDSGQGSWRPEALGDAAPLEDPGSDPWLMRETAIGGLLGRLGAGPEMPVLAGGSGLPAEWGSRLVGNEIGRGETRAALRAFGAVAREIQAEALVLIIPDKAQVDDDAARQMRAVMGSDHYRPGRPYDFLVSAGREADLRVLGGLHSLRAARDAGPVYFARDWHTNAAGNRALAGALADRLLGPEFAAVDKPVRVTDRAGEASAAAVERAWEVPGWILGGAIWLVLGTLFWRRFPEVGVLGSYGPVGGLLIGVVSVYAIATWLVGLLPHRVQAAIPLLLMVGFIVLAGYYLRGRVVVMGELFLAFVRRGHWYMLPVIVALLSVGGLLVVAASSPWLAPFIYTLF